jgi:hypothetical protein
MYDAEMNNVGVTTDNMGLDSEEGGGVTWGTAYHGDNVPGNDVSGGRRGRGQYGRGLHDGMAECVAEYGAGYSATAVERTARRGVADDVICRGRTDQKTDY